MKGRIIRYIIISILVIGIAIVLANKKTSKSQVSVKTSGIKIELNDNFNELLDVYTDDSIRDDYDNICYKELKYCSNKLLSIKVETKDAILLDNYKHLYFFYIDNDKVKMYNSKTNKSYTIDRLSPKYYMDFIIDDNDQFIGVLFSENINEKSSYLLIEDNSVIYNKKYDTLVVVSPDYLYAATYDNNYNQTGAYLLSLREEKEPIMSKEEKSQDYYGYYKLGNKYITYEYDNIIEIYDNKTLKQIYRTTRANTYDKDDNLRYILGVDSHDNILVLEDKKLFEYNSKGVLKNESSKEIEGLDLVDKYVITTNNEELNITDIKNNVIKICSLKNGDVESYEYVKTKDKEGIYFIVKNGNVTFDELYNSCKKNTCKDINKDDLMNRDLYDYGYEYFFNYKNSKITSKLTFIDKGVIE